MDPQALARLFFHRWIPRRRRAFTSEGGGAPTDELDALKPPMFTHTYKGNVNRIPNTGAATLKKCQNESGSFGSIELPRIRDFSHLFKETDKRSPPEKRRNKVEARRPRPGESTPGFSGQPVKDNSAAETGKIPAPAGVEIRRKAEPDASLRSISGVAASAPFPPSVSSLAISSGHFKARIAGSVVLTSRRGAACAGDEGEDGDRRRGGAGKHQNQGNGSNAA